MNSVRSDEEHLKPDESSLISDGVTGLCFAQSSTKVNNDRKWYI